MQDSFQNKMSEIIWGSWGRETQPSTATASHDYNQIVLLIILGNRKNHTVHDESTHFGRIPQLLKTDISGAMNIEQKRNKKPLMKC